MESRGHLATEQRNPRSRHLDAMSVAEAFAVLNNEDRTVAEAVTRAEPEICTAVGLVEDAFRQRGRLIYVGAGTSGRLGVLDAAECPPTFLTDPRMVQGVIAGGADALQRSIEGAEDRPADAVAAMDAREVGPADVVFGITTGGTTPFVHAALHRARQRGARTVLLACVDRAQVSDEADVSIRVVTGPEVIAGSTRLKAGTATKMVLNMITTISMVRCGKVYENLMVDMNAGACAKLRDRAVRVIETVTGLERPDATALLDAAGGRVKAALVMHLREVDQPAAEALLAESGGAIRPILGT